MLCCLWVEGGTKPSCSGGENQGTVAWFVHCRECAPLLLVSEPAAGENNWKWRWLHWRPLPQPLNFCCSSVPLNKGVRASRPTCPFSQGSLNLSWLNFFSAPICFLGATPGWVGGWVLEAKPPRMGGQGDSRLPENFSHFHFHLVVKKAKIRPHPARPSC